MQMSVTTICAQWAKPVLAAAMLGVVTGCANISERFDRGSENVNLVVGTYSQKGSEGIYQLQLNPQSGQLSGPQLLGRADNPSFLSTEVQDRLYAVNETGEGMLTTYRVEPDGRITEMSSVETGGASPCYVAVSPDQQFVATANYMGGNVSIFRLSEDKVAQPNPQLLQHSGSGPNADRQEAPHAHWVQWDERKPFLYAVDLGIDEIKVYPFDAERGRAGSGRTALKLAPGDGPRHMFFHPNQSLVYVLNELSNTITVAEQSDDGTLQEVQRISTLPGDFSDDSHAAHIHVTSDGRFLYASNRGHNSIAVFAIEEDGLLELLETEPVGGEVPRHFLVLEEAQTLLVANQESHNIVVFSIKEDGTLTPTGQEVELPQATFLGRFEM